MLLVDAAGMLRSSIDRSRFFPRCCNQRLLLIKILSSIAHADAPDAAADQCTAVVAAITAIDLTEHENYDEVIVCADAARSIVVFAVSESEKNRRSVPLKNRVNHALTAL